MAFSITANDPVLKKTEDESLALKKMIETQEALSNETNQKIMEHIQETNLCRDELNGYLNTILKEPNNQDAKDVYENAGLALNKFLVKRIVLIEKKAEIDIKIVKLTAKLVKVDAALNILSLKI